MIGFSTVILRVHTLQVLAETERAVFTDGLYHSHHPNPLSEFQFSIVLWDSSFTSSDETSVIEFSILTLNGVTD